jgi:N4-gp56 family major capsid protein
MAFYSAQATTLTTPLGGLPAAYYKKEGLDQVLKKFMFRDACVADSIPKRSGHTVQWFRYGTLAANTTARTLGNPGTATEGQISAGSTNTKSTVSATVGQYADFISLSDFAMDVHIDDTLTNAAKNLGYRAGLTVDTLVRNEIDTANGTAAELTVIGANFAAKDAAQARHALQAVDVEPMDSGPAAGYFYGLIHPYVSYDLVNDPGATGFFDLMKHADPDLLLKREDRGWIGTMHGVKFYESTNVAIDTGATPDTYRVYVFGKGGVGAVELAGRGPTKVKDPKKQAFSINMVKGGASIADPEGVIGGIASYNFVFVSKILDATTYRFRIFDANSSIAG